MDISKYVKVQGAKGTLQFPLDEEGVPLKVPALQAQHPSARGLLYTEDQIVVPAQGEHIRPLPGGWGGRTYSVLLPEPEPSSPKM